ELFLAMAREHAPLAVYRLFLTGFLTGLRPGELCGLRLDDDLWQVVDGHRVRHLRVERQVGQDPDSLRDAQPTSPKKRKRRLVEVADALGEVVDAIKAERKRVILERSWPKDTAWMFTTGNGTPFGERNLERVVHRVRDLTAKAWKKAHPTDDVPSWGGLVLYSMRHTFAVTHIIGLIRPSRALGPGR